MVFWSSRRRRLVKPVLGDLGDRCFAVGLEYLDVKVELSSSPIKYGRIDCALDWKGVDFVVVRISVDKV